MTNLILRAKQKVIFMLAFGIPFILYIVMMVVLISGAFNAFGLAGGPSLHKPMSLNPLFGGIESLLMIAMFLAYGTFFAWTYAVNVGLKALVPEGVKRTTEKFMVCWLIPVIYFSLWFLSIFGNTELFGMILAVLSIPIMLFFLFAFPYIIYFTARTLKVIELQRDVTFLEYCPEVCMIAVMPIGIWAMQPKINQWMDTGEESPEEKTTETDE